MIGSGVSTHLAVLAAKDSPLWLGVISVLIAALGFAVSALSLFLVRRRDFDITRVQWSFRELELGDEPQQGIELRVRNGSRRLTIENAGTLVDGRHRIPGAGMDLPTTALEDGDVAEIWFIPPSAEQAAALFRGPRTHVFVQGGKVMRRAPFPGELSSGTNSDGDF